MARHAKAQEYGKEALRKAMRDPKDLARELGKIYDTVRRADEHFMLEAQMNAALHMSETVRPAPLAVAVSAARDDLRRLIDELEGLK